jgi:hypothetical protein
MSKETGGSMYPGKVFSHFRSNADCNGSEAVYIDTEGLTIRDYFAGQALSGLMANNDIQIDQEKLDVKEKAAELCAVWCYSIADAMLAERSKT